MHGIMNLSPTPRFYQLSDHPATPFFYEMWPAEVEQLHHEPKSTCTVREPYDVPA